MICPQCGSVLFPGDLNIRGKKYNCTVCGKVGSLDWNFYLLQLAYELSFIGEEMNKDLRASFTNIRERVNPLNDLEEYWLASIETATWIIGGLADSDKFKIYLYNATVTPLFELDWESWKQHLEKSTIRAPFRGTGKNKALDHLLLHSKILKECYNQKFFDILSPSNIINFQRIVISKTREIKGAGLWMATSPIKVIIIANTEKYSKDVINQLEVPLGSAVIEGLHKIFGVNLDKDSGYNFRYIQEVHRYFAELINSDVFTINSEFFKIGETSISKTR